VPELPTDAYATGGTPGCRYALFAIGQTIWTTQYHPEMTHEFVSALTEEHASQLPRDVVASARQSLGKSADRQSIASAIVNFFEHPNHVG